MHQITDLERQALVDLLRDLKGQDDDKDVAISEGLLILGYDEEEVLDDLEDEENGDDTY